MITNNINNNIHPSEITAKKRFLDDYMRIKGRALHEKNTYYCVLHPETKPSLKSFWFHNDPSLGIRKAKCFSCGRVFDIYDLVEAIEGVHGLKEQYYRVCEVLGESCIDNSFNRNKSESYEQRYKLKYEDIKRYLERCSNDRDKAIEWWGKRGISNATIQAYGLAYDRFNHALVIPVENEGYITRFLKNQTYRYKRSPGLSAYFSSKAMASELPIILTEGEIDALSVIELGYPNVVALGSISNLINVYKSFIKSCDKDIVVAVDTDSSGEKWMQQLIETCTKYRWRQPVNLWDYYPEECRKSCKDLNDCLLASKDMLAECLQLIKDAHGGTYEKNY